jgi:2-C-methyl-D-erythritol 2,4-cyclodiphosphate synthase
MPVNVDLTVICQSPKIVPYAEKMQLAIASDLGLEVDDVSIKATTTEGLGFSGRGEGITAQAIVLIQSW